jgi:protein SCO1/2
MTNMESSAAENSASTQPAVAPPGALRQGRSVRYTLVVAVLLAIGVFLVWRFRPVELHGILLQTPRPLADFTLTASTGEPMSLSDLRGQYVLVYFGYTSCPDVCPLTLTDLAQMAKDLGAQRMQEVQVLLITVDPERDTAEQLARYLPNFDPSFLGMTGTVEEIEAVAAQFGIYLGRQEGSPAAGYLVDHTNAVSVVDPDGYLRLVFTNDVTAQEMAADLRYLMRSP